MFGIIRRGPPGKIILTVIQSAKRLGDWSDKALEGCFFLYANLSVSLFIQEVNYICVELLDISGSVTPSLYY